MPRAFLTDVEAVQQRVEFGQPLRRDLARWHVGLWRRRSSGCAYPIPTSGPAGRGRWDPKAETLVPERACMQVSRGDRTAIELFVAGVRGWKAESRRILSRN